METRTPQKLYAYVDESGQDTSGALFLVSVVITGAAREGVRKPWRQDIAHVETRDSV